MADSHSKQRYDQAALDLDNFVYAVSHDMSAPIRAVSGFSRLILDRENNQFDLKTREQFNYIIRAGEELQAMLEALTEYSRLSTRPNPAQSLGAETLLQNVLEQAADALRQCEARVDVDIEKDLMMHGDIPRLKRLFESLVSNAIVFRQRNRPLTLCITGWQDEKTQFFSVSDNGIGLTANEETRARIFRPFGRLHRPEDYPGIGMGLTLAQKIALLHAGAITCDSTPGEGSTFIFSYIPAPA